MKLKKFYQKDLTKEQLKEMDRKQKENCEKLMARIDEGSWNEKQKKYQKRSIIPKIALYQTFLDFGYEKEQAKELTRKLQYHDAEKANKLLKIAYKIPRFRKILTHIFTTTMAGDEVWETKVLRADDEVFRFDITKCTWKDSCDFLGYPEICDIFCGSDDIFFADIQEMGFERTGTLAQDCDQCDFKFTFHKKGRKK